MSKFGAKGLRDAEISFDTVYLANKRNLRVDINIDEGEVYYFGDIDGLETRNFVLHS